MQSCKGRVVSKATSISLISFLPAAFVRFNTFSQIDSDGCFPPLFLNQGPDSKPSAANRGRSPGSGDLSGSTEAEGSLHTVVITPKQQWKPDDSVHS